MSNAIKCDFQDNRFKTEITGTFPISKNLKNKFFTVATGGSSNFTKNHKGLGYR